MIGLIYPIIVAWTWGEGWLFKMGFEDFAGSGIVHLTGGISGLVGTIICGPRLGKYKDFRTGKKTKELIESDLTVSPQSSVMESNSYSDVIRKFMNKEVEIEDIHAFVRTY